MSDYSQITDFSAKDALTTGDPEKIILGSDMDAELAAISVAIATKLDPTDFTSLGGVVTASAAELNILDGATLSTAELNILDGVTLTASNINDAALKSASNTFTANQTITVNGAVADLTVGTSSVHAARQFFKTDSASRVIVGAPSGASSIITGDALGDYVVRIVSGDMKVSRDNGSTIAFTVGSSLDNSNINSVAFSDFARLSQSNVFTATQTISGTDKRLRFVDGAAPAGKQEWFMMNNDGILQVWSATDGTSAHELAIQITKNSSSEVTALALLGDSITLNGVASTDFARLSQSNTFTGATQTISAANAAFVVSDTGGTISTLLLSGNGTSGGVVGTSTSHPLKVFTNNTSRYEISSDGNHDFKSGTVLAAQIANSTSTTLVAGQLHFVTSGATLPNLTAGQWIQIVNDSGSSITISVNGSDTTYWTATGATVSTSFTLAARGVLTARCNPAGSSVYVSGSGITAAS